MSESHCTYLDAYLEDALTTSESRAFVDHLEDCPSCRHELDKQRQLDQLLKRATDALVPAGLVDRIGCRLRAARRRRRAAWIGSLAATMLLGMGVAAWLVRSPPERVVEPRTTFVPSAAEASGVSRPRVEVTVTSRA